MRHSGDGEREAQECQNLFCKLVQCAELTKGVVLGWWVGWLRG